MNVSCKNCRFAGINGEQKIVCPNEELCVKSQSLRKNAGKMFHYIREPAMCHYKIRDFSGLFLSFAKSFIFDM